MDAIETWLLFYLLWEHKQRLQYEHERHCDEWFDLGGEA